MPTLLDALCVSDDELHTQIDEAHSRWNASHNLRLFTNDVIPTPEDEYADYTEPTLTGYAAVDTTGEWTTPARDEPGVWSMQTEIYTFLATDDEEEPETVYGGWIETGGEFVAAGRFAEPFEWDHSQPLRIRVIYSQFAAPVFEALLEE